MSNDLAEYRRLEQQLWLTRFRNAGAESVAEDALLDEMEAAWQKLSEGERALLSDEGPKCWPMESAIWPPSPVSTGLPFFAPKSRYHGVFTSAADTILSADAA